MPLQTTKARRSRPLRQQQPYILAFSTCLLLTCILTKSSSPALHVTKNDYSQHLSHTHTNNNAAVADSTTTTTTDDIFCNTAAKNKEHTEDDISCDRVGQLEDTYNIGKDVIGGGHTSEGRILTHKTTGKQYVSRFLKEGADEERADGLRTVNLARKACGNLRMMQLADMKCFKESLILVWTLCDGEKLMSLRYGQANTTCQAPTLSLQDIQIMTRQLVNDVVNFLMDRGAIHGDIFFQNIFYNKKTQNLCLIDFDTSRFLDPGFNLPENRIHTEQQEEICNLLINNNRLHKDDMLAVGVVLGGLIGIPTFRPTGPTWMVHNVVQMLGVDGYKKYTEEYKLTSRLNESTLEALPRQRTNWSEYIDDCNRHLATKESVDFFDKVMRYSFMERYEFFHSHAAAHPFLTQLASS